MNAPTVSIDRSRVRVRARTGEERSRLMRLQRAALGEPLTYALAALGVRDEQLICIRQLQIRLSVSGRTRDGVVLDDLIALMAEAVLAARDRGDAIAYTSRRHAIMDLVWRAAIEGDTTRAWAWQQLGLWEDGADNAVHAALLALLSEPAGIVPVLVRLASEPAAITRLEAVVPPSGWRSLVRAALRIAGVDPVALNEAESRLEAIAPPPGQTIRTRQSERLGSLRTRLCSALATGRLRRALLPWSVAGGPTRAQAAALVLLEADPDLLRRTRQPALLIEEAVRLIETESEPSERRVLPPGPRDSETTAHTDETLRSASRAPVVGENAAHRTDLVDAPSLDERVSAATAHAGLLFLLHLMEPLLSTHSAVPPLDGRPLRWVLHEVAGVLVPELRRDDPARLAFAGLSPDVPSPDVNEPASTDSERRALFELADALKLELSERMRRLRRMADETLRYVVLRRGRLSCDPGWIEVQLSLDEVSTDIRGAGLDCDLNYLPWLGVVVRFVYE